MSEGDEYVCTLDTANVQKARLELNEDEEIRMHAVDELRAWIRRQPHLNYRTDTNYLLQILRTRKYNQREAQLMIERNLRSMASQPRWFRNIDTRADRVQAVLHTGVFVPLPGTDDEGRKVVLSQRGALDPDSSEYNHVDDFIRAALAVHLYLCRDEGTQVNGLVHFYDFSAFSTHHMKGWGYSNFKNIIRCWALYVHGNSLESVYDVIPKRMLPVEYLPEEYKGPNAGTLNQLIDELKQNLLQEDFRQEVLHYTSSDLWIDDTT